MSLGTILSMINFKTKVLVPFCLLPSLFLLSACSETTPSDEVSSETAISTEEENVKEAEAATLEKEAADKVAKEEADKLAAEVETARVAQEEADRVAAEAETARVAQEEADRLAAEAETARVAQEAENARITQEEADRVAAEQATAQQNAPAPAPAPEVNYKNCTAVKDAGAAPLHAGQPGYGKHLDRDGDGVACEN